MLALKAQSCGPASSGPTSAAACHPLALIPGCSSLTRTPSASGDLGWDAEALDLGHVSCLLWSRHPPLSFLAHHLPKPCLPPQKVTIESPLGPDPALSPEGEMEERGLLSTGTEDLGGEAQSSQTERRRVLWVSSRDRLPGGGAPASRSALPAVLSSQTFARAGRDAPAMYFLPRVPVGQRKK